MHQRSSPNLPVSMHRCDESCSHDVQVRWDAKGKHIFGFNTSLIRRRKTADLSLKRTQTLKDLRSVKLSGQQGTQAEDCLLPVQSGCGRLCLLNSVSFCVRTSQSPHCPSVALWRKVLLLPGVDKDLPNLRQCPFASNAWKLCQIPTLPHHPLRVSEKRSSQDRD